jgi:hypothetical protein
MTQGLTPEGERIVAEIASRYGFSGDAALCVLRALSIGNGAQAQFNHPDLGGMGQWSQGGMIMIGDMFNQALKARVDGLCRDLADLLRGQPVFAPDERPVAGTSHAQDQAQSYDASGASVSLFAQGFDSPSRTWWPDGLGHGASMGSQNDLHYAYFPSSRRLAIKRGGRVSIFDSGDHRISGVSQQQGGDQTLTFTSQHGVVRISDLKPVSDGAGEAPRRAADLHEEAPQASNAPPEPQAPGAAKAARTPTDIFAALERLAELNQKSILSDEEFAAKKAELLGRL